MDVPFLRGSGSSDAKAELADSSSDSGGDTGRYVRAKPSGITSAFRGLAGHLLSATHRLDIRRVVGRVGVGQPQVVGEGSEGIRLDCSISAVRR